MANISGNNNNIPIMPIRTPNAPIRTPVAPILADILPIGLDQQIQQPYIQKGLTYKSNNKFVMNRDDAGNIILDPGSNSETVSV